jgi:hypothetical protein
MSHLRAYFSLPSTGEFPIIILKLFYVPPQEKDFTNL